MDIWESIEQGAHTMGYEFSYCAYTGSNLDECTVADSLEELAFVLEIFNMSSDHEIIVNGEPMSYGAFNAHMDTL
jgi:hypothetical protein